MRHRNHSAQHTALLPQHTHPDNTASGRNPPPRLDIPQPSRDPPHATQSERASRKSEGESPGRSSETGSRHNRCRGRQRQCPGDPACNRRRHTEVMSYEGRCQARRCTGQGRETGHNRQAHNTRKRQASTPKSARPAAQATQAHRACAQPPSTRCEHQQVGGAIAWQ